MNRFLSLAVAGFAALATAQDPVPKSAPPEDKDPITTKSGMKYSVLQAGEKDGQKPELGDRVKVNYTGWLEDGTEFDTNRARGGPVQFALGAVIPGWNEGVALMTRGTRGKFTIPPTLAYGEAGAGRGVIPPNATLTFEIELVDFEKGPAYVAMQADKVLTAKSGLEYEIASPGTGDVLTASDSIELQFGVWTTAGGFVMNHFFQPQPLRMPIDQLPVPFMQELALELKEGGVCMAEVPVADAFPSRKPPQLGDDTKCIWMVKVAQVFRVPAFEAPVADKLTKTASGLQYEVLREGTGKAPAATDTVQVHYAGWLEDGTGFDSSYGRGEPAEFPLNGVIAGWTEGVQLMKEGAIYQFVIPGNLAYGLGGSPPKIGPNATLVFRIELLKVK